MEIDWKLEYEKELRHWREIATTLADYVVMMDAFECGECEINQELQDKALELVEMFHSREDDPSE